MSNLPASVVAALLERCGERARYWIIKNSHGLWEQDDLPGEALLVLHDIVATGDRLDPANDDDVARFLRELRRRARRAALAECHAMRPDQACAGEDWQPGMLHWDQLAADDGEHPLVLLEAAEATATPEPDTFDPYHSEIAAWAWLAHHFDRRTRDMAAFLLISPSWCRQRRRRARRAAGTQWPLACQRLPHDEHARAIQPWRRFKLPPRPGPPLPAQAPLDFWQRPMQPERGQLWLL